MNFLHTKTGLCGRTLLGIGMACVPALTPKPAASEPKTANKACSPAKLQAKMAAIAQATQGPVGAAVLLVEGGTGVALHGGQHFPMQSVYKLPIAMAVLRQVDAGTLSLAQTVQIGPNDLAPASRYSPIARKYPKGTQMTVSALLDAMVRVSDGTASDVLMTLGGGPNQVTAFVRALGIPGIRVATTEKAMAQNEQAQYQNWATPEAMALLLRALQQGHGLSPSSRHLLLNLMLGSATGPRQIKGLLPPGTAVAHKTGGSGTVHGLTRATNDAGLVTLPDGRHLAVVVFVSDTKADAAARDAVIAQIARAAWDCRAALESGKPRREAFSAHESSAPRSFLRP